MMEHNQQVSDAPNRLCPQCGVAFTCGVAAGHSQCWCFNLPRIIALDDSDDRGCLCPTCLSHKIEMQLKHQQASKPHKLD